MSFPELSTKIPITQWNRNLPLERLIKQLFTNKNRKELDEFFEKLKDTVRRKQLAAIDVARNLLKEAKRIYAAREVDEAITLVNRAIRKAAKNSKILKDAIKFRGEVFMMIGRYEKAIIDYELLIKDVQMNGQHLDVVINTIECCLALGYREKAKCYISLFGAMIDECFAGCFTAKNDDNIDKQIKYETYKKTLKKSIDSMKYVRLTIRPNTLNMHPYLGFNENSKIRHSSIACSLSSIQNNREVIFANRCVAKGEILAVERPFLRQQYGHPLLCDNCYTSSYASIPCFDCHSKSYCSYDCKVLDENLHKFECVGYRIFLLQLLESELLFRFLMQYLIELKERIFCRQLVRDSKNAAELIKNVAETLKSMPYDGILSDDGTMDYSRFPEMEYVSMVSNAFRLTIYVSKFTSIVRNFFVGIQMVREEIEIFIATLLLYLNARIITTSFRINIDPHSNIVGNMGEDLIGNELSAVEIDYEDQELRENSLEQFSLKRDSIESDVVVKIKKAFRSLPQVNGKINSEIVEEGRPSLAVFNTSSPNLDELLDHEIENNIPPNVLGLYSTMMKFSHSCDPNMRLIYLSSGVLLAKASRDIKPGEMLTISYGCHYKKMDNLIRSENIRKFNICCPCQYCNGKFNSFFPENMLCIVCRSLVSPSDLLCLVCGYDMIKTHNVYKEIVCSLEARQEFENEKQLFHHLIFSLSVYDHIFPITNHLIASKWSALLIFLAEKNFAYETYFFATKFENIIKRIYVEQSLELLHGYNLLVTPLIDLIYKNLNKPGSIVGNLIETIYNYSIRMMETMLEINDFNIINDPFTCDILKRYHMLLNLKERVYGQLLRNEEYRELIRNAPCAEMFANWQIENDDNNRQDDDNDLEAEVREEGSSLERDSSLEADLELSDDNSRSSCEESNETILKELSGDSIESDWIKPDDSVEGKPTLNGHRNYKYCFINYVRRDFKDIFVYECELYFRQMIESRNDVAYFLL